MLMLIGMASVLTFLTVLILAISLMTRVIRRVAPEIISEPGPLEPHQDARLVAVISAAIHQHRQHSQRRR